LLFPPIRWQKNLGGRADFCFFSKSLSIVLLDEKNTRRTATSTHNFSLQQQLEVLSPVFFLASGELFWVSIALASSYQSFLGLGTRAPRRV
jgi:hypothetical protein